jgi:Cytochrome c3
MEKYAAVRRSAGLALMMLVAAAAAPARPPRPPQSDDRTCFACHRDEELKSPDGTPIFVDPEAFTVSVHGRAGIGCVGCHADLAKVEEFPHAPKLGPVSCARCHEDQARTSLAGVHGLSSPRLVAKPVLCKDCHGHHDVLAPSEPRSPLHADRRPQTCAKCHPGAGPNFSKGRVHAPAATARLTPVGAVRTLYRVLIGVVSAAFLAYAAVDVLRFRRER